MNSYLVLNKLPALAGIPEYRQRLLFISSEDSPGAGISINLNLHIADSGEVDISGGYTAEPSTIYTGLLVDEPKPNHDIPELPYFPTYSGMSPVQRYKYLEWLCDVTKPISIGFVFVYYYGLEKHLIGGNFDEAFKEILLLRKYHSNSSFQQYSASALLHVCLLLKKVDKLFELYNDYGFDYFDNSSLLILHQNNLGIPSDMLLKLAFIMPGVNRKYMRSHPELFEEQLKKLLDIKYQNQTYEFASRYDLSAVEGIPYPIFANVSLPQNIRTPPLPNLVRHAPFQNELIEFYNQVNEFVKVAISEKKLHKRRSGKV